MAQLIFGRLKGDIESARRKFKRIREELSKDLEKREDVFSGYE